MKFLKKLFLLPSLAALMSCSDNQPPPPAPYGALPSQAQLDWHDLRMYAMVCFGLNTFTDEEWGYGDVNPAVFNPSQFDAEQIVGTLKSAGFKGVLLVAKHHDGFCLWPSETTDYTVAASPWKDGKGDMVRDFEQAARRAGLKFGVYNSPWDRNAASYGTEAYLPMYQKQLEELHTNYGDLFISWYDGANGGDGFYGGAHEIRNIDRTTYYQWDKTWQIVTNLQPNAVIFSDIGPGVRWVGNEIGIAAETSWSTYSPTAPDGVSEASPGNSRYQDAPVGTRNGKTWLPAECNFPIRPGWYYHAAQDDFVKSPYELFDTYFQSIGRGACLDLGIAPDKRGILHENDVTSITEFGKLIEETFRLNLAEGASIQASNNRGGEEAGLFSAPNLIDGDNSTYWATDDGVTTPEFTVQLKEKQRFNIIQLKEHIALGQRIDSFAVDIWQENQWQEAATATSVGYERLIRLPGYVETDRVRVRILSAPVCPAISGFGLYAEPERSMGTHSSPAALAGLNKTGWKVTDAPGGAAAASALIDGKVTYWQGAFAANTDHNAIVIDMGKPQEIKGILFSPVYEAFVPGLITKYSVATSTDGKNWDNVAVGEFGNIRANPIQQQIAFGQTLQTRYIKLVPQQLADDGGTMRIAEIGVF